MRFYMAHPWTKMRKLLEEEYLCECLKGRVQYFNTRYRHVHDGMGRMALYVDGELWLNMTFMQEYIVGSKAGEYEGRLSMCQRYQMAEKDLAQEGIWGPWDFGYAIHQYLNQSIQASLESEDLLVRMLAFLDRRVGKRTLKRLKEQGEEMPEWLCRIFELRLEGEGIK